MSIVYQKWDFKEFNYIVDMCLYNPGQFKLIEPLLNVKIPYIFISSGAAYKDPDIWPIDENNELLGMEAYGNYGVEKAEVEKLTVENNATDRTNLIRDVEENSERIDELIDYLIDLEEEGEETLSDVMSEFDDVYETQEGFLLQFNQIIKLQARIKTLENTMEYLTRRPMNSDGR